MDFSEFGEFFESARPAVMRSSPTGGPRGGTGGAGATATPRSADSSRGAGSGRAGVPASGKAAAATGRPQQTRAATPPTGKPSSTRPSGKGKGFSFDRFMPYVTQGFDFVRQGTQIAQQFGAFPRASGQTPGDAGQPAGTDGQSTAQPAGLGQPGFSPQPVGDVGAVPQPFGLGVAGQPAASVDQLGILLQALRQRQIPPLPGQPAQASPTVTPAAPLVPQADGMALLRLILGNPQFQQALQWSAVMGSAGARTVELPVPATSPPSRMRSVPIPLGAVMNAISALAGRSMTELNESTREDDPEVPSYLVDEEGEFIVDPASSDDRAALVAHLFRVSDQAQRSGPFWPPHEGHPEEAEELDESEVWADEAGFTGVRTW